MQRLVRFTLVLAALAVAPLGRVNAGELVSQPGSKLWLVGSSTVHAYTSKASKVEVEFKQDGSLWPADATGAEAIERFIRAKGVTSMDVEIGVTGMHSGKDGLDRNMHKALHADKHPEIRFRMTGYEVGEGSAAGAPALDAKGKLTVAGVEREIRIPVKVQREGGAVRLTGSVPLLMTQFGIKPPTMMMGALRTSDQVTVHFDLVIGSKGASGAMSDAK